MTEVQRARLTGTSRLVWLVVGDGYLPVEPIRRFLVYLEDVERSPNTLRAYAHHLKLFWEYLAWAKLDWTNVGLGDLAGFLERVMNLRLSGSGVRGHSSRPVVANHSIERP